MLDLAGRMTDVTITISNLVGSEGACQEQGRVYAWDFNGRSLELVESHLNDMTLGDPDDLTGNVGELALSAVGPDPAPIRFLAFLASPPEPVDSCSSRSSEFLLRRVTGTELSGAPFIFGSGDVTNSDLVRSIWTDPEQGLLPEYFYAFEFGAFEPSEQLFLDGREAGGFQIVGGDCAIGDNLGTAECELFVDEELSLIVFGEKVNGTVRVLGTEQVPLACGAPTDDPLGEAREVTIFDGEALRLGAHLCGIPREDGSEYFTVASIQSDLQTFSDVIVQSAIADLSGDDGADADNFADGFACGPGTPRDKQPVLGWLPRSDEFPVIGPDALPVTVLEETTDGSCGSYRGGTSRLSYLVYGLRTAPWAVDDGAVLDPAIARVISSDIAQLRATTAQAESCDVNNGRLTSTLSSILDKVEREWGRADVVRAMAALEDFIDVLEFRTKFVPDLPFCFFDSAEGNEGLATFSNIDLETGEAVDIPGAVPRNFRGDLLWQARHLRYMLAPDVERAVLGP